MPATLRCDDCHCFVSAKNAEVYWEPDFDDDHGRPIGSWVKSTRCTNPNCDTREVYLDLDRSEVYG